MSSLAKVAMYIFEWKKSSYLLIVDYYSRYIEIAKLNRLASTEVIMHNICLTWNPVESDLRQWTTIFVSRIFPICKQVLF